MSAAPKISGQKPENYAGDVEPSDVWLTLTESADAVMVDVRTRAEWGYVGLPDLSVIGKSIVLQEWQSFPSMERQADFEASVIQQLEAANVSKSAPVFLLCRSGVRSLAAAVSLTERGYECCCNVKDGFEGPTDEAGHRGAVAGWKASGLPWRQ